MRKYRHLKILLFVQFVLLTDSNIFAQSDSTRSTQDFRFANGIYTTFEDFKTNTPNLTKENFKQYNPQLNYLSRNFFESSIFNEYIREYVFYPGSNEELLSKSIDSLFGYVIDGFPFTLRSLKHNAGFKVLRIFRFGTISYCLGTRYKIPTKEDSTFKNDPVLSYIYDEKPLDEYLLEYKTGKLYKYDVDNFEDLLQDADPYLYAEFTDLSRSKKRKLIYFYLNKVNERHPVYIPN